MTKLPCPDPMITAEGEAISGIAPRSPHSASDVSIDVSSRGEQWAGLGWARLAGLAELAGLVGLAGLGHQIYFRPLHFMSSS